MVQYHGGLNWKSLERIETDTRTRLCFPLSIKFFKLVLVLTVVSPLSFVAWAYTENKIPRETVVYAILHVALTAKSCKMFQLK